MQGRNYLFSSLCSGPAILVKKKKKAKQNKTQIGSVMQTTFIVEQETNNSSAQFPVDQLERYLRTTPAIRSFLPGHFSP